MHTKQSVGFSTKRHSRLIRAISGMAAGVACALATAPALSVSAAPTSALIYVANSSNNSVSAYALGSSGNVAPTLRLQGTSTGLSFPSGVAVDGSGDLYVANGSNSITEYAPGATGDVAPVKTISGTNTGLLSPELIAVDGAGNVWVANAGDINGVGAAVLEFAANAIGNTAPIVSLSWATAPFGVAADSQGHLFVANRNANSVTEVGWTNGIWTPAPSISGPNTGLSEPVGVALDGSGNVFVANIGNGVTGRTVTEYASGATGNVAPISTIGGSTTGLMLPEGLALDPDGNIFVADRNAQAVFEFAKGSTGDVAPVATISGSNTRLSGPEGLALYIPPQSTMHPTATFVSCTPASVVVGEPTSCSATVTDTFAGVPNAPSGSVLFATTDPGTFGGGGVCTLPGTSGATASCSVTYMPTAAGAGVHTIVASYRPDAAHAASSGSANLTVTADTDLGLAGVPADQTVNATGPGGAAVSYAVPTAVDEETPPAVSCDHASGSIFPIGTTTVHCSASDADDNPSVASASFSITVVGAAGQLAALSVQVQGSNIAPLDKALLSFILNLATTANNAGNQPGTCMALTAFGTAVGVLEVLPPPLQLDPSVGQPWAVAANQIRAVLSC